MACDLANGGGDMSDSVGAVLAGGTVRVLGPRRIGEPAATGPVPAAPRVVVVEEGGQVRGVEITCRCGEVIRLSFETDPHD